MSRFCWAIAMTLAFCLGTSAMATAQAATPASSGTLVHRSYTSAAGTRAYDLYVPSTGGAGKPLMIWLHGCGGPDPLGQGHSLTTVAEEQGFTIAFPIQPASANPLQCWNWFSAADQHRGAGEPDIIAGITTTLRDELGSDNHRIYLGGYSAGGAMTTVMGAAYPDLYAAIAPSAGAPYQVADLTGRETFTEMGPRARPVPSFMLQGITDEISNYLVLGRTTLRSWLGADDYADDGTLNYSVSRLPASVTPQMIATTPPLPVTVEHYQSGQCAIADFVTTPYEHLINGALFYYAAGLDLQRTMMNFLLSHELGGPGQACG